MRMKIHLHRFQQLINFNFIRHQPVLYKMLLLTSLLIPTIFTNLISYNDVNAATTAVLTTPSSRAYNCFVKINYGCDVFKSNVNVGAIIGSADFIKDGPKDGELASAGNSLYDVLDEHRSGRWSQSYLKIKEHNATHFVTDIAWIFSNKTVVVDKVQVFLSDGNYTEDQPIRRSSLNLACSYQTNDHLIVENYVLRFNCYISSEFIEDLFYLSKGSGILLSTLKIAGTNYAFYQSLTFPFTKLLTRSPITMDLFPSHLVVQRCVNRG